MYYVLDAGAVHLTYIYISSRPLNLLIATMRDRLRFFFLKKIATNYTNYSLLSISIIEYLFIIIF